MESGRDPELKLQLGSCCGNDYSSSTDSSKSTSTVAHNWFGSAAKVDQQHVTIFYGGRISVCDVTEFQAKAIICMAMREMEERSPRPRPRPQTPVPAPTEHMAPQQINPALSMKRSLQRFLQKRKTRMDAASPYNRITAPQWDPRPQN